MPDIYPLRNDHKHKFLDLESRITRDELIFTNFVSRTTRCPECVLLFSQFERTAGQSIGNGRRRVSLSRSIVQIFVVTNRIQLVFIYNDRHTHSCFSAIQLTTSSSLSQNLGRLNLFTTRVTNNRYSTIPTLYIYNRPTLAYLSPRLFVRIPIYRNAYELCTVHRNVIFTKRIHP